MSRQKSSKKRSPKASQNKIWPNKPILFSLLLISVITLSVYSPVFHGGFLNWDDDRYVMDNPAIRNLSPESIGHIFSSTTLNSYNPLVILSFAVEYKFSGLNPATFHVVNLIIHLINSLFVFWLIFLVSKNNLVSLFTALLFSVHPLHVEAVAWIAARKEVLYSFFYLASIISYLYYRKNECKPVYLIISLLLFLLSVLSKPVAVTLPAILILLDWYLDGKFELKNLKNKIGYIALAVAFGIVTYFTFNKGGAVGSKFDAMDSILIFFHSLLFYIYKLFVPVMLSPVYAFPVKEGGWLPWIYIISPLIVAAIAILILKTKRYRRILLFGTVFFLMTILPVSNIIPVKNTSLVFDRFTYIPYIGLFFIFCVILSEIYTKGKVKIQDLRTWIAVSVISVVLVLSYLSYEYAMAWSNAISLRTDMIEKYPDNAFAYFWRGDIYYKSRDYARALDDFNTAIRLDSTDADFFNGRGNVYRDQNIYDLAIADYDRCFRLNPQFSIAYNNLGILYTNKGNYAEALANYNKSIEIAPDFTDAYTNRGNMYFEENNYDSALVSFNKALEVNPIFANALYSRGVVYKRKGEYGKAIDDLLQSLQIDPDFESAYQQITYVYYLNKDYNKSWDYLYKMKDKKFTLDNKFIEKLQKESGRKF